MKNVVYFSLFIPTIENPNYYSMLYHALETLQPFYKNQYDVVVFYSTPDADLKSYIHLNSFNLITDFPWVKFIESDYHTFSSNIYMHKWYNLEKVFDLGYDRVFYLDCDIVFNKDPAYMFERYNDKTAWALYEGNDTLIYKFLGYPGVPSGQLIISRTLFEKCDNLYERVLLKQTELIERAQSELTETQAKWFVTLSEQYSAQAVMLDSDILIRPLSMFDVNFGVSAFEIELNDQVPIVKNGNSAITHYFGKNDYIFVPDKLKTPSMRFRSSNINPDTFFKTIY